MAGASLIEARNLTVEFTTRGRVVHAVTEVDLDLCAGEVLAVVGESGSGKSQMLLSMLGLTAPNSRVSGSVRFEGQELLGAPESRLNQVRARKIGYVFQDPMTSLNPYLSIGLQLTEPLLVHKRLGKVAAAAQAIEMLRAVHISDPEERMRQYPHQLSGGMRQRVAIAMALICGPEILIADEPTTALDVTVQAQVLALLREARERLGTAVILVTHDLGVIAELADRVNVMYAGRIVEKGTVDDIFYHCRHPYTEALENSIPELSEAASARLTAIEGNPPDLSDVPAGCAFHPRCPYRLGICDQGVPPLERVSGMHLKACFYEGDLGRGAKTAQ
ncbi:MAG TPA: ABC transporter ATP-binding protein [Patescibacteria group bacterium]|nr:ABC transporter ATP-binding protein [Patescibacteria group bacterium]